MAATREPALDAGPGPVVGAALVTGAAALWATFGLFAKHLYDAGFAPLELASVRAFIGFAGVALFVLLRSLRGRRSAAPADVAASAITDQSISAIHSLARVPWRTLPFFAAYGVIGFALFEYTYFAALERTSVAVAVALLYTAPAFVALASAVVWRERVGVIRWLALGLVSCGVVLVTGATRALLSGAAPLSASAAAFGLASGATYALYTMFGKIATERYGPAVSLFWSFFFATAALAMFASPVAPLLRDMRHVPALIGLGIVPTLIPYALYLMALRRLRASTAAMLAATEPAIATVLAAVVLGERFDSLQGVGLTLILFAAIVLARDAATPWRRVQASVGPNT